MTTFGEVVLSPHHDPAGLPCEGGWAEAQPVAPDAPPRYRCRACGAVVAMNDPALRDLGEGTPEAIKVWNCMSLLGQRLLDAALGSSSNQRHMAAQIHLAPAGTVPLLLVTRDLNALVRREPLLAARSARFQADVPRRAVPGCIRLTAEEILVHYDSAAGLSHEGPRCLVIVQVCSKGQVVFDQASVVWLQGESHAPRA